VFPFSILQSEFRVRASQWRVEVQCNGNVFACKSGRERQTARQSRLVCQSNARLSASGYCARRDRQGSDEEGSVHGCSFSFRRDGSYGFSTAPAQVRMAARGAS
jgi:hypothetical protein